MKGIKTIGKYVSPQTGSEYDVVFADDVATICYREIDDEFYDDEDLDKKHEHYYRVRFQSESAIPFWKYFLKIAEYNNHWGIRCDTHVSTVVKGVDSLKKTLKEVIKGYNSHSVSVSVVDKTKDSTESDIFISPQTGSIYIVQKKVNDFIICSRHIGGDELRVRIQCNDDAPVDYLDLGCRWGNIKNSDHFSAICDSIISEEVINEAVTSCEEAYAKI